jgi:hypothetical protein
MSDTTIAASSVLAVLQPYLTALATVIVPLIAAWGVGELKRYTGIAVSQTVIDKVDSYIADLAAREIAAAADNLATKQIDVGSPLVKQLLGKVLLALPTELQDLGLSSDAVAAKIAAAFGRLQASMTVVPAPKG